MEIKRDSRKLLLCLASASLLLIMMLFPFDLEIAPARDLRFVDNQGRPIANALIRQTWDQYSLNEHGGVLLRTDADGSVLLKQRHVRTRVIDLLRGALNQFRQVGVHASYFSSEFVSIWINARVSKQFVGGKGLEGGKVVIDISDVP